MGNEGTRYGSPEDRRDQAVALALEAARTIYRTAPRNWNIEGDASAHAELIAAMMSDPSQHDAVYELITGEAPEREDTGTGD
jgi:hypothetical protein